MSDFGWDEMDPALEGPGVGIRRRDNDSLAQALIRLDAGLRTDPLFAGLPHDQCQCAHWGYIISGTMRVHTADGHADYEARPSCTTGHPGITSRRSPTPSTSSSLDLRSTTS